MNMETAIVVRHGIDLVFNLAALSLLTYYSMRRRFKNEKVKSVLDFIGRWRIEIIFAGVLIPQWADWLPRLLKGG